LCTPSHIRIVQTRATNEQSNNTLASITALALVVAAPAATSGNSNYHSDNKSHQKPRARAIATVAAVYSYQPRVLNARPETKCRTILLCVCSHVCVCLYAAIFTSPPLNNFILKLCFEHSGSPHYKWPTAAIVVASCRKHGHIKKAKLFIFFFVRFGLPPVVQPGEIYKDFFRFSVATIFS
jgi:hypothetical protein